MNEQGQCGVSSLAAALKVQPALMNMIYRGGDGSSMEQAVIIRAPNHVAGIDAEYYWARKNHPTWSQRTQALVAGDDGKQYDIIDYITPEGKTITIYFDITDFFGKRPPPPLA